MIKNILSCDILLADIMVPLSYRTREQIEQLRAAEAADPKLPKIADLCIDVDTLSEPQRTHYIHLNQLIDEFLAAGHTKRGQKLGLSEEQFVRLTKAMSQIRTDGVAAGGSASNTLNTLCKLLGNYVNVDFLGVVARSGAHSNIIRDGLEEVGINLIPNPTPLEAKSAISHVINGPEGKTTLTYRGNAREILKPEMITDELVEKSNAVFIQGSSWEKFEHILPDTFTKKRWLRDRELWLALPTQSEFKTKDPNFYQYLITSSDVVLGNQEELMRVYQTSEPQDAIEKLQSDLAKRDGIREQEGLPPRAHEAKAFITDGENPAIVVTPHKVEYIPVIPLPTDRVSYHVGAGDTAFAGFLAGHIAGLTPKESAELAVELAYAKMKYNSARIPLEPGPRQELQSTHRGRQLWQKVEKSLKAQLQEELGSPGQSH